MIDFHCHLDLYPDPFDVARQCRLHDLYILSVTTTPSAWSKSATLSIPGDRIRVALGLHPEIAHERKAELGLFEDLLAKVKYVGEVGLDGSPQYKRHQDDQTEVFARILSCCASSGGRIISLHSRRAVLPVVEMVKRYPAVGIPILHWFSGSADELKAAIDAGFWFSVGSSMLESKRGVAVVENMPRDRILTETDGPFARTNGTSLMPWDVGAAESLLAGIWQITSNEVQQTLQNNLRSLLRLMA